MKRKRTSSTADSTTLPIMLTVTDAEHLRTVFLPIELVQTVGVFNDMIESLTPQRNELDPVPNRSHFPLTVRLFSMSLPNYLTCLSLGYSTGQGLWLRQVSFPPSSENLTWGCRKRGAIV